MQIYNKYIVIMRYKKLAQCGNVNLPYGTECVVIDKHIICDKGIMPAASEVPMATPSTALSSMYKNMIPHIKIDGIKFGVILYAKNINVLILQTIGFGIMIFIMRLYSISSILQSWLV